MIAEAGGVLSHASTIARGDGPPAIASVPECHAAPRSGDRARLNANQGLVQRLSCRLRRYARGARGKDREMNTVHVNACIVGGGPAGMMLGLLLARRGASVLVLEGHENFDREYRGEVLQPSTAHLLDEIGLLQYILEQPHSRLEIGRVRFNGKAMGGFSFKRIAPSIRTRSGCRSRSS